MRNNRTSLRALLREKQREHALILLGAEEFYTLRQSGDMPLPQRHAHHFHNVLRRRGTWSAWVGDGCGTLLPAKIQGKKIHLTGESELVIPVRQNKIFLVQAIIRPAALALVVEKAAELGADAIVLAAAERSVVRSINLQRLDAILENACMQAYNPVKPQLYVRPLFEPQNFAGFKTYFGDPTAEVKLKDCTISGNVAFVNGPEGGFSPQELSSLRQLGTGVTISENVLRAETAAIIALGILCHYHDD